MNSAKFSPGDQPRILTASDDTTVRILECNTCGPLDELRQRAKNLLTADERAASQRVAVGQCFPGLSLYQDPVNCTSPHQDEVFAVLNYSTPDDASFPADLNGWAHDQCTGSRYRAYRGQATTDDSEYYTRWSVPRSLEWDLGRRSVICVLTPRDHQDRTQAAKR